MLEVCWLHSGPGSWSGGGRAHAARRVGSTTAREGTQKVKSVEWGYPSPTSNRHHACAHVLADIDDAPLTEEVCERVTPHEETRLEASDDVKI